MAAELIMSLTLLIVSEPPPTEDAPHSLTCLISKSSQVVAIAAQSDFYYDLCQRPGEDSCRNR